MALVMATALLAVAACSDSEKSVDIGGADSSEAMTWVATWGASPQVLPILLSGPDVMPAQFTDQTIRMIARISKGGPRIRVRLDNTFGTAPLSVGAAHVALHADAADIVDGTDQTLRFDGSTDVTVAVGESILSDPIDLDVPDLSELVVSLYLPEMTTATSGHSLGVQTTYVSTPGDFSSAATFPVASTSTSRYFLSGIEVETTADTRAIVTLGDSITDGFASTVDANNRWPDQLAEKLFQEIGRRDLTIVNEGISGNRVLNDIIGPNALSRLDRDVLTPPGATFVTLLEGINDIGFPELGQEEVSADDIIQGYREIIARAHTACLTIYGATLTPFEGAGYYTAAGETKRQTVNDFIRNSGEFDGVIDFDAAVRDPANPTTLLPAYDSGDHLHPSDAGYEAMAQSIDLGLFDEPVQCVTAQAA
ncbi:SGNH/GDSL hydrolase family protein [Salinisphaera aquimarina]